MSTMKRRAYQKMTGAALRVLPGAGNRVLRSVEPPLAGLGGGIPRRRQAPLRAGDPCLTDRAPRPKPGGRKPAPRAPYFFFFFLTTGCSVSRAMRSWAG